MNRHKRIPITESTMARFMKFVRVRSDGCWEWSGMRDKGYGRMKFGNVRYGAHRVAAALLHGEFADDGSYHGMCVCHMCDNAWCVNPLHLMLGSAADNVRDRDAKGRGVFPRGDDRYWTRKISESDARNIRDACASGELQRVVSARYGIGQAQVSRIVNGKRWTHVS